MEAKFYLKDDSYENILTGNKVTVPNVLFFSLFRPGFRGGGPTEFDNRATKAHVATYREAYTDFKKANSSYVLEWPELDVEIVPPIVEPSAVEEVPVVDNKIVRVIV